MDKVRRLWVALFGAALLIMLAVGGAFAHMTLGDGGAPPVAPHSSAPWQGHASNTHDENADEDSDGDTDADEDSDGDTDADEDADEDSGDDQDADEDSGDDQDADEDSGDDQDADEDAPTDLTTPEAPTTNHGACVSAVAVGDDVGLVRGNHGEAVSEAARVTCWAPVDDTLDDLTTPEAPTTNHGACVSAVAVGDDVGLVRGNHGEAVSEAARVTCWATDGSTDEPTDGATDNDGTDTTQLSRHDQAMVDKAERDAARNDAKAARDAAKDTRKADKSTSEHGKSTTNHGKSSTSHGKSSTSHGHAHGS